MPLVPGRKVGPFEILQSLGAGGMGEVWKARDTRLDRIVAIKEMPGDRLSDPDRRRRFLQEARAASALNHPNIVTIYDLLEVDGIHYIVMEHVSGRTLDALISSSGMRSEEALRIATQVAAALAAAHGAGVVHRDLKPANVMVGESGQVKVLDFGLAKLLRMSELTATVTGIAGHTMAGTVVGTAAYMSPEQAEGRPVDARSDIFSFGAMLYEMVTGRKAFRGTSPISIMAAVLGSEPEPLPAGVPGDVERIVARCLRKERDRRYQQAVELKLALEEAAAPAKSSFSAAAPKGQPALIVLPFANLSPDKDNNYFADGLTEEILSALSAVAGLRIIARTSTFAARERELTLAQITEQMKVTHALEGSVRRAGNRIRVTTKLFTTSDQTQLWSERYDREVRDIFEMQDEIARAVVAALKGRFAPSAGEQLIAKPTSNVEAYSLLVRARYDTYKLELGRLNKAEEHLRLAVALDPNFAEAHAMIALRLWMGACMSVAPPRPLLEEAAAVAGRALAPNPQLPLGLSVSGVVAGALDWNWKEFNRLCSEAYTLAPNDPDVAAHYAFWLLAKFHGRYDEALAIYDDIAIRDPLSGHWRAFQAALAYHKRDYARSRAYVASALEIDSQQLLAHWIHCAVAEDPETALEAGEMALRLSGRLNWAQGTYALALARAGRAEEARALRDELVQASRSGYVSKLGVMDACLACVDFDGALEAAEQMAEDRSPEIFWLVDEPSIDPIRRTPRFSALLKRIGLPERH